MMAVNNDTKVGTCSCISFHICIQENVLMFSGLPLSIDKCWSEHICLNSFLMIKLKDLIILVQCNFTTMLLKET